jgi:hypothetical protein
MDTATLTEREAFITADGEGRMRLTATLVLLCCCAHAYSRDDTVLTGG